MALPAAAIASAGLIQRTPSVSACPTCSLLKSIHLDSFWPAFLELPPGASLHATFRSALGQKYPGLWAGRAADMQNLQLPLKTAHFLPGAWVGVKHEITAEELWPLRVNRNLELIRVRASTLRLNLSEFPGLLQGERVLITASACHLTFPSKQVAPQHLKLGFPERLRVVITNAYIYAPQIDHLIFSCKDSMDASPLSVLLLRNTMLAMDEDGLSVTSRHSMCQPEGKKEHSSYGWSYRWGLPPWLWVLGP